MARNASQFTKGQSTYACRCCGHVTRQTGRGDNDNVGLCAPCYDLAGEENSLSDNGEFYAGAAEVLSLIASVKGDASCWDALKATAQAKVNASEQDNISSDNALPMVTGTRVMLTGTLAAKVVRNQGRGKHIIHMTEFTVYDAEGKATRIPRAVTMGRHAMVDFLAKQVGDTFHVFVQVDPTVVVVS